MTPLEQFNEEVIKEFKKLFISEEIAEDVPGFDPIEYDYEWSGEPIDTLNFITQKLTEHKELILKMVREKFPNTERGFLDEEIDPWQRGFNACLDQIKDELESL